MPPPKHTLAACAVVVLLAACGPDGDGTPTATPSTTPFATASTTATASPSRAVPVPDVPTPTLPAQAATKSSKGASSFVEYAIAVINRAYLTGDTKPLEEISTPDCASCADLAELIDGVYTAGGSYTGGQSTIRQIRTIAIAKNVVPTVETVLDVSELHRLGSGGDVVKSFPARKSATLLWDLSWSDSWSLAEIREPQT